MAGIVKQFIFNIFVFFFLINLSCLAGADENALPVASDYITFEQNFDSSLSLPEMAAGNPNPVLILGKLEFRQGLKNTALFCGKGGGKIRYSLKGNIDFNKPGTVAFWFFTNNWRKSIGGPRTLFFATECSQGYFGIQTADGPKNISSLEREIFLRILYSSAIPDCSMVLPPLGIDGDNKWHLLVFAWNKNRIFMSLDGNQFSSKELVSNVSSVAFPSEHFSIGADAHQNYLLDEFRIYSKKLSDAEVAEIWKNDRKERNKNGETEKK